MKPTIRRRETAFRPDTTGHRDSLPDRPEPCPHPLPDAVVPHETLDVRDLKCPLPVLHTRRALARLPAGAILDVWCTDPLAGLDIPNLLRTTGDVLLASTHQNGETRFEIMKAEPAAFPAAPIAEDPSVTACVD